MAPYTLVIPSFARTPEGFRREITRLRRRIKDNPDDQGLKVALAAAEGALHEIENVSAEERNRLLANIANATV
jgi:hypothetical protein